ncbi:MAG: phenylalanine--tRNA ligase subunit beta [Holosporales bacterium]|jgi:phenylalanyl-tRNA synthetase beta chain|nr:phenylalanine--tRNA ligase subunit beta [Holosporales bacterium]
MKFTFDWLKDHLDTTLSSEQIADKLTDLGIEIEEVVCQSKKFENFVVGFVKKAGKHPNADKLQVCEVDIGSKTLQIVCGAKNAREGIYAAVALVGAIIPSSNEPLKKGVIREVESQGMMCSSDELLLEDDKDDKIDGIIELPLGLTPGQNLASALEMEDVVFDVSITPNRADCFSVRGIARDLAASGCGSLIQNVSRETFPFLNFKNENPIDVEIRTDKCGYFSTVALENISGNTPKHIARRLKAIGQKLIHFPVDIANYVCIDIGQPLHIFDLNKLPKKLIVRDSKQGEKIKTLDGKETILPDGAVVVASENEPLSIAGIMGGEDAAFSDGSRSILIEGACFNKAAIAKAGQFLKISSDSRMRFERGIDADNTDFAVQYAASLIAGGCDCKVSEAKKYGSIPNNKHLIELTFKKFQAISDLTEKDFTDSKVILERLGMIVKSIDQEKMVIETPSWRHDLEIEEDVIEEILRIRGFENIKEVELEKAEPIVQTYTVDKISDALVYNGYYEAETFSFIDYKTAALFSENENALVKIKDALTIEFSTLRPSVIASHLKSIKNLQSKSQKNVRIFEVGKRFFKNGENVIEENTLVAAISEKKTNRNWRTKQEDVSVFDIKEDLEKILNTAVSGARLLGEAPSYYHPGRSGTYIFQKDTVLAYFGEIHPSILQEMEIAGQVVCFELFVDKLPLIFERKVKQPLVLSQYQPTTRDFSFIVQKSLPAADILNAIKKLKSNIVKEVKIFDVYESDEIGEGNKAVAFEVLLQSDKYTLSEEEISETSAKIIDAVSKNCNGTLRDGVQFGV